MYTFGSLPSPSYNTQVSTVTPCDTSNNVQPGTVSHDGLGLPSCTILRNTKTSEMTMALIIHIYIYMYIYFGLYTALHITFI